MDSHLPSIGWSPTNIRMIKPQKEVYYRLTIWQLHFNKKTNTSTATDGHLPSIGWSPTLQRMGTHQPKNGHPPEGSVLKTGNLALRLNTQKEHQSLGGSPTRGKCTIVLEFGNYTLLTKLTPGDNFHGWSPTIPWRVLFVHSLQKIS